MWGGGGVRVRRRETEREGNDLLPNFRMSQGGYKTPSFDLSSEERSSRVSAGKGRAKRRRGDETHSPQECFQ